MVYSLPLHSCSLHFVTTWQILKVKKELVDKALLLWASEALSLVPTPYTVYLCSNIFRPDVSNLFAKKVPDRGRILEFRGENEISCYGEVNQSSNAVFSNVNSDVVASLPLLVPVLTVDVWKITSPIIFFDGIG